MREHITVKLSPFAQVGGMGCVAPLFGAVLSRVREVMNRELAT